MAAEYGREVALTWNSAAILGVREKSLTIAGEPVNVTSDEDSGVQTLLDIDAEKADFVITDEGSGTDKYGKIFINENKISGAIIIGDMKKSPVLKAAIEKGTDLSDIDLGKITVDGLIEKLKSL